MRTHKEELTRFVQEHQEELKALGVTKGKASEIVSNYYKYMKQEMRDEELPTIRLRFLGKFTPAYRRLQYHIRGLKDSFMKGNIEEKEYLKRLKKYEEIERLKSKRLYG